MHIQFSKLSRRAFLQMAAATAAPAILAACAPTAAPTTGGEAAAPAAPSAEKVTVRYIGMDYDSRMQPDTQALFDEFNASQDEIEGQVENCKLARWTQCALDAD